MPTVASSIGVNVRLTVLCSVTSTCTAHVPGSCKLQGSDMGSISISSRCTVLLYALGAQAARKESAAGVQATQQDALCYSFQSLKRAM